MTKMGSTITQYGKTVKEALEGIRTQIKTIYPTLQPDGDVALIRKNRKTGKYMIQKIFKTILVTRPDQSLITVRFIERRRGNIGIATTVSANYYRKPENNEWLATIHLE